MFFGTYGDFEDGTYSEWLAVRKEDLCLIPDNIDDVSAAGIPVAYLTAQVALSGQVFSAGKTVLAPAIGGSIGNAVTLLANVAAAKARQSCPATHVELRPVGTEVTVKSRPGRRSDCVRRILGVTPATLSMKPMRGRAMCLGSDWRACCQSHRWLFQAHESNHEGDRVLPVSPEGDRC